MDDCVFCKIATGEIPAKKIYEDDYYLAFLDIAPNAKGHTLVIPKEHVSNFIEMTSDLVGESIKIVHKIAPQIVSLLQAGGFNIGLNNGKAAGQVIDHVHWHIIPRYPDDGLISWQSKLEEKDRLDEVYNQLVGKIS